MPTILNFFEFVKYFFQSFLTFSNQPRIRQFSFHRHPQAFTHFSSNFSKIAHLSYFVNNFFRSFPTKHFSCARFRHLSADSFVRIPKHIPKVNPLFCALLTFSVSFFLLPFLSYFVQMYTNISYIGIKLCLL